MTARADRRHRATRLAAGAAVAGVVATAVLGMVGVDTLADSRAGRQAEPSGVQQATARFPSTPTGVIGVADDDGQLTSVVVAVVEPDGTGGSLIVLSTSADAGFGMADELRPLGADFAVGGAEALVVGVERLTGLSFDVAEVVDVIRLGELLDPLGDLTVFVPAELADESTGETWQEGRTVLPAADAARLVAARAGAVPAWHYDELRATVWDAVAARVGAGIGSANPVAEGADVPTPASVDELFDRLFAGPVAVRPASFRLLDADQVAADVAPDLADTVAAASTASGAVGAPSIVAHDRSELLLVFATVAPGRLGAPLEAPTVRIVAPFADDQLASIGRSGADVAVLAIDRLFAAGVNVASVAIEPGDVPAVTQVEVADAEVINGVLDTYPDVVGAVEASLASEVIDGVDLTIVLGQTWLDEIQNGASGGADAGDPVATSDVAGEGAGEADDGG